MSAYLHQCHYQQAASPNRTITLQTLINFSLVHNLSIPNISQNTPIFFYLSC